MSYTYTYNNDDNEKEFFDDEPLEEGQLSCQELMEVGYQPKPKFEREYYQKVNQDILSELGKKNSKKRK